MDLTVPVLLSSCVSVLLTKSSSPVVGLSTAYAVPTSSESAAWYGMANARDGTASAMTPMTRQQASVSNVFRFMSHHPFVAGHSVRQPHNPQVNRLFFFGGSQGRSNPQLGAGKGNIGTFDGPKETTKGSIRAIDGSKETIDGSIRAHEGSKETTKGNFRTFDGPKEAIASNQQTTKRQHWNL